MDSENVNGSVVNPEDQTPDNYFTEPQGGTYVAKMNQRDIPSATIKPRHLVVTPQAKGTTYYSDGTNFSALAVGNAGQVLTLASGVPTWATPTTYLSNQFPTVTVLTTTTPTATCTGNNNIIFTITLTGNTTYAISGAQAGQILMFEVKQGAGTTYTNTWFAGVHWVTAGSSAPVQTPTTNGYTTYGFRVLTSSTFLGYLVGSE